MNHGRTGVMGAAASRIIWWLNVDSINPLNSLMVMSHFCPIGALQTGQYALRDCALALFIVTYHGKFLAHLTHRLTVPQWTSLVSMQTVHTP